MDISQILQMWLTSFIEFLPKILAAIFIFIFTLFGSGFIAKWVKRISSRKISSNEILQLIYRLTRWSLLITGTIIALDQVNFNVAGFIAGLGVAGFTVGFALQDIAKNFISGLMLLYRQPFNLGDMVEVSGFMGVVREINLRDTVVQTLDGELVIIPNRDVFEKPIINYTDTNFRRRKVKIGLGYDEDVDWAIDIFLDAIKSVSGVETDPAPIIRADELAESALSLTAMFWINQQENDLLLVHSEVVKTIKKVAEEHKMNLPYPIQTILWHHQE